MDTCKLMAEVEEIVEDAKAAVLGTVDRKGKARLRWMTPVVLNSRCNTLYAVSSPGSTKISDLEKNPDVEWLVQTRSLDKVIKLRGKVNVVDNPSLKSEVLEKLAGRLTVFWKVNPDKVNFVVLETILEEAEYFQPMTGLKKMIKF
jgi:general stress protein 26